MNWKKLAVNLAVPLAVGGLATLISGGMADFKMLNQPPLSPPGWVFPVVWTILYLLMGWAAYRVQSAGAEKAAVRSAMTAYYGQLALNFLWPILFFKMDAYLLAFVVLLALWAMVCVTMWKFYKIDETAGDLLIPYLLWITFAGYLNLGVYFLN